MEVPFYVLKPLSEWDKNKASYDQRFVAALLLSLTANANILENDIPAEVMDFVRGNLIILMISHFAHLSFHCPEYIFISTYFPIILNRSSTNSVWYSP